MKSNQIVKNVMSLNNIFQTKDTDLFTKEEINKSMLWYRDLDTNQKINLKDLCSIIVGIDFQSLNMLFSFREKIAMLWHKLSLEGFDV